MASTTTAPALKILTVGSALGQISQLFDKIRSINAKHGKFDLVLCLGDFFGRADEREGNLGVDVAALLEGKLEAPLPCYLMAGEHPVPPPAIEKFAKTGGELCANVFLLGKSSTFTTAEGLRIACLGGTYEPSVYHGSELPQGFTSPYFSSQTVSKLLSSTLTSSAPKGTSLASIMSTASPSSLIDILITHAWPSSITELSDVPLPSPSLRGIGAPPVDEVISKIRPRYIFASGGGQPPYFWEREPFVWDEEGGRVSRFVGLGAFGGEPTTGKKQRWFYAFSVVPQTTAAARLPQPRPPNATKNPFTDADARRPKRPLDGGEDYRWGNAGKRVRTGPDIGGEQGKPPPGYRCKRCDGTDHFINDCPERQKPPEGYICRICNTPGHLVRDCPTRHAVGDTGGRKPPEGYVCRACANEAHYIDDCPLVRDRHGGSNAHDAHEYGGHGRGRGRRPPPREIGPDECWFCLSNPAISKHLIVAIGAECYLTLPKGQLPPTRDAPTGAHIPGIPGGGHVLIVPIAHFTTLSSIPTELRDPVLAETNKLKAALRGLYAKHAADGVFFEVGRLSTKGGHAHVQALPVPRAQRDLVEQAFRDAGSVAGISFEEEDADAPIPGAEAGSYFRVELPDGRRLVHWMREGTPFSLQFGRQVIASVLKLEDRVDWKACLQSEEDDTADAQAFKAAFAPFDPSS